MGQGYSVTTLSAGSAGIDVPELADLTYEKSLGTARFMKSVRARHKNGLVVARVVQKPYSNMKLEQYITKLLHERKLLSDIPNALGYHRILETSTNGYLVRQYMHSSLYDRLSTRPFLDDIEKKWIAFQLLCVVRDCHARDIYHGDIKTENLLVTSWNWLYLADFSSAFKPAYLPEDNPADFSFYFDISGRRTCYLAPERFYAAGSQPDEGGKINWAMDIFSVGCVIAELLLETPIFTLSQIFKYKQGEYDPVRTHLNKIQDNDVRELVTHMIQVEPDMRYAADEYLNFWRKRTFPDYFYNFLHQYMYTVTDPTSGRKPVTSLAENLGESDERIEKLYNDFDKISYSLGLETPRAAADATANIPRMTGSIFPLTIDIPNYQHQMLASGSQSPNEGVLIFVTLVVSSIRSTARANARVQACELLLAFSERITDDTKVDRILPYLLNLTGDSSDLVTAAAIRAATQILSTVEVISPMNAPIFPDYVLPHLNQSILGSKLRRSAIVRMTYAACLGSLTEAAYRFLQVMQSLQADGVVKPSDPRAHADQMDWSMYEKLYDISREDLLNQLVAQTTTILADTDVSVRRAFLGSVGSLCHFLGNEKANDVLLSHLNTYLNDDDWQLRCAFFETIVGVAVYVGSVSLEKFVLPLIIQALADPEDFVVERAIRSLSSMSNLGLFQASTVWDLIETVSSFTMHPNPWIREAAAQFISISAAHASMVDVVCIITPLISPFLKFGYILDYSDLHLLTSLKKPLSRAAFEWACTWATSTEKGIFWSQAAQQRALGEKFTDGHVVSTFARDQLGPKAFSRVPRNDEDEQWLSKLRTSGMTVEDEIKLLALRAYIWRVAQRRAKSHLTQETTIYSHIVTLKDAHVPVQTIFFDDIQRAFQQGTEVEQTLGPLARGKMPRTISDALLDASTTDDALSRRKISHLNSHAERVGSGNVLHRTDSDNSLRGPTSPVEDTSADESSRRGSVQMARAKFVLSQDPSPVGSVDTLKAGNPLSGIRHKGSAINLLNRGDRASKATAATSTSSENAFGSVGGGNSREVSTRRSAPSPVLAVAQQKNRRDPATIKYETAHSYKGNDPSVLKVLDTMFLENYPVDSAEFGPSITPITGFQPLKSDTGAAGQQFNSPWRPEGRMVALLGEHTATVTRIAVASDHAFFVTGSEDGTVKVWDVERLERNLAHRSKLTYRLAEGAKVTSLCFVTNTHCLAITGSDGSVHIIKIPISRIKDATRFGRIQILREHQLAPSETAIWSEHYKAENQSILLLSTTASRVIALDLRTMTEVFSLQEPIRHGIPLCFCLDQRSHYWLLLGTSHGVISLWDLRFKVQLRSWALRGFHPIHRICAIPSNKSSSNSKKVYIAGGTGLGEITTWDLEKQVCLSAFRTDFANAAAPFDPTSLKLMDIQDDNAGSVLRYFATNVLSKNSLVGIASNRDNNGRGGSIAMAIGAHMPSDSSEPKNFFIISAGPDWCVRYWDPPRADRESSNQSMVVSGLSVEQLKPVYEVQKVGTLAETLIVLEKAKEDGTVGEKGGKDVGGKRTGKRSSVISVQQQHLLRSHLDTVMDVALVERPFGMVISADRAGMTYVWK